MLTRMRLEAIGESKQYVVDHLLAAAQLLRDQEGGNWEQEESDMEIISSDSGYWGRLTIRRVRDEQNEQV